MTIKLTRRQLRQLILEQMQRPFHVSRRHRGDRHTPTTNIGMRYSKGSILKPGAFAAGTHSPKDSDGDGVSNADELRAMADDMDGGGDEDAFSRALRLTGPGGALELDLGDAQVANLPIDIEEYILANPGVSDADIIAAYEDGQIGPSYDFLRK